MYHLTVSEEGEDEDKRHDYITVLSDGGESKPLPTWKTYCKYITSLINNYHTVQNSLQCNKQDRM